jgi:hypothetical protein
MVIFPVKILIMGNEKSVKVTTMWVMILILRLNFKMRTNDYLVIVYCYIYLMMKRKA